jgi:hypothetical protein
VSSFKLYRSQEEHSVDCAAFPFDQIPRKVFLDTNIVNCLVKWPHCIFEMQEAPEDLDATLRADVEALMHIFHVGSRAQWDIVASNKVLDELSETADHALREALLEYGANITAYSAGNGFDSDHAYANDLARRLRDSAFVSALPDINDRDLIAHAVAFRCDVFCTRDRRSIYNKRNTLHALPLRILTPADWWQHIRPWAGLWC